MIHINRWCWGTIAASVVIAFFIYAKVSSLRFRRRAIEVNGTVLKVFPHRKHTAFFIEYTHEGNTRVAEYAGLPLVREFQVGEQVRILIDSSAPPNVDVPGDWHNQPVPNSTCELPDKPLITLLDVLVVGGCIFLIAYECGPWFRRILADL